MKERKQLNLRPQSLAFPLFPSLQLHVPDCPPPLPSPLSFTSSPTAFSLVSSGFFPFSFHFSILASCRARGAGAGRSQRCSEGPVLTAEKQMCCSSFSFPLFSASMRCPAVQGFFPAPGVPTTLPRSASTTRGHRTLAAAHFKPAGLGFLQLFWHFCFCAIRVAVRFSRTLEWREANLF